MNTCSINTYLYTNIDIYIKHLLNSKMPKFDNFHILKTFRVIQSNLSFYSSHWELHAKIDNTIIKQFLSICPARTK